MRSRLESADTASTTSPAAHDRAARVLGPTDADLIIAVGRGSQPAFEELRRRYQTAVERTCARTCGSGGREDCAQESFARIWQKAGLFDEGRGSAAGWLLAVTRNVARSLAAKHAALPTASAELSPGDQQPDDAGMELDRFWIAAALERLPQHERQVIELAYYQDLSQSQIARVLNVPLGTVKTWTRQGLHRLATLLDHEAPA